MSKRKSEKPRTRARTGPKTMSGRNFFKLLLADDPIFKQGWIVGQTFSGASPKHAQRQTDAAASRSTPRQLTEQEIQAELDRMRKARYGTVEIGFAEAAAEAQT